MNKYLSSVIIAFLVCINVLNAQTFTSGTLNASIPPGGTTPTCYPISVSGLPGAGTIDGTFGLASVCLNIDHTWDGDLRLALVAPDGTSVLLVQDDPANAGLNFTGTCFTATATTPISGGTSPYTGDYLAVQNLGTVNNGQNGNGTWTLCILDTYEPSDFGTLIDWSLTFNNTPAPPPSPTANIDEPCNAFTVSVNATCTSPYQVFDNTSATASSGVPDPGCGNYQGSDVWLNVVVPTSGSLIITTEAGTMTDGAMAIYSGTCSNLTLISCDANSGPGPMPQITATGLTPGNLIWIRVWSQGTNPKGTFGLCVTEPPPPPPPGSNFDEPCGATPLSVGTSCNYSTFDNSTATATQGAPAPGCANYLGGDVWFTVVVPASGSLNINTQAGVITDAGMAIYSGNCGNLTLIDCDDDSGPGLMPLLSASGLTPGDTVWIRVWEYGNDNNGTFDICVTIPPPPPANDEPCNAISITPDINCNYVTYTNENATSTPNVPAPGCSNYAGGDVWFSVVVPAGGGLVFDSQTDVITDGGMALYTGSCNNLTLFACDDDSSPNGLMPKIQASGLTPGDTVWVRFWEYGNDNNGNFGLCVTLPPPPPANDEPCGAVLLTADITCNPQTFSNDGSTGSTSVPDPGCATYLGGDVWFKVVVPASGRLKFDTQTGVITDGGMAVYSGSCSNLNLLACDDNSGTGNMPQIVLNNLNPGDTIWVRFWENGNNTFGDFDICITTPPPPPANDEPCNATSITPSISCNYQTYSNENASSTQGVPAPGCANYQGGDVWFSVVVPPAGALYFDSQTDVITDGGMALYTGTCNNLSLLSCDDDSSPNGLMPRIRQSGLTPGDTIWVRFWEYGGDNNGNFGLCVTLPPPPPTNDDPCTSFPLPVNSSCQFQTYTNDGATTSTGMPDPGCAGFSGGDVWFTVQVPQFSTSLLFDTQADVMTDGGMAIYTGASCSNLALLACDDNTGTGNMPQILLSNLAPGSTLWVRVWENGNDNNGNFGICVTTITPLPTCSSNQPAGNTCPNATPICNFNGYCGNTDDNTYTPDSWPALSAAFCGSIENNSFISFVASSDTVAFNVWVTDSRDNLGIQMFFYETTACGSGSVTGHGCYSPIVQSNIPRVITGSGLVPGQTYYLMFDGYAGDSCGYRIDPIRGVSILNVTPSNPIICAGSNVTLTASGGTNYTWTGSGLNTNSGAIVVASPATTTTYTVASTTSINNCPLTKDVTVTVGGNTAPPTVGPNVTYCQGATANPLAANGAGLLWYTAATGGTGVATLTPSTTTAGTFTYYVTQTLTCGESPRVSTNVIVTPAPVAPFASGTTYCQGTTAVALTATGTNLLWYPTATGGTGVANAPTPSTSTAGTSTYYVSQTVSGCESPRTSIAVTVNQIKTPSFTQVQGICVGGSFTLPTTSTNGVSGTWSPAINNQSTTTYTFTPATGQCASNATMTVSVNTTPTIPSFTQVASICKGGSFSLPTTSTNGVTGTWSPAINNQATTTYTFTSTAGQCAGNTTMTVTVKQPSTSSVSLSICDSSLPYRWNGLTLSAAGTYTKVLNGGNSIGCDSTVILDLKVNQPRVDAGAPLSVYPGSSTPVTAIFTDNNNSTLASVLWTPSTECNPNNQLSTVVTPVATSGSVTYQVTVTDNLGCSATDDLLVNIINQCINVRNAFSPNGDGINDLWVVYDGRSCLKNVTVTVFNRYGNKVYENVDYFNNWGGTYKGKPIPDGTYYAVIDFTLYNGKKITTRTDVTVVR